MSAQVPTSVLAPDVDPANVPPAAGIATAVVQASRRDRRIVRVERVRAVRDFRPVVDAVAVGIGKATIGFAGVGDHVEVAILRRVEQLVAVAVETSSRPRRR